MTITVTATVEADNLPPRVRLDVLSTGTTVTQVTLGRLDPDGRSVPVRTGTGGPLQLTAAGGNYTGLAYDYEMPYGEELQYGTNEGGLTSGLVTVPITSMWLVHPGVPDLSQPIEARVGSLDEIGNDVARGVFYPLGRENPVVITDGRRKGDQSTLVVHTQTAQQYADLSALLRDSSVLLLQVPPSLGVHDFPTCYVSIGATSRRNLTGFGPERDVVLPFVVVDRPAGGSQSERTFIDVLAENASFDSILAKYSTLLDLLAPTT